MLAHSNMPNSFWPYTMKMATYLHNRLHNSAIDSIPYESWTEKSLQWQDLEILKPFGCIVWDQIPKQNRKRQCLNKLIDQGARGCFIGYISSMTYLYWNFQRQEVIHSYDLTFHETEFPQRSDFYHEANNGFKPFPVLWPSTQANQDDDDVDSDSEHIPTAPTIPAIASAVSTTSHATLRHPHVIYDEIIVEKPPHIVFSMEFGPLADSTPNSFADAMNWPDSRLWWEALCNEIKAVIQNNTWSLVDLPPEK
jgi:hypothetical protein